MVTVTRDPTVRTTLSGESWTETAPPIEFELPPSLEATSPPELRGGRRDAVRLLVLDRATGAVTHTSFDRMDTFLRAGDLLVLNDSRTVPALLRAVGDDGAAVEVRLADRRGARCWDALLLDGRRHVGREGMHLIFGDGLRARARPAAGSAVPLAAAV